jgi:catechol 2,3-dioxygenase-like lactoylglutathione lyase family enzyme
MAKRIAGPHLRIARPVSDLARTVEMYCRGLGLRVVGSFEDHEGFDGVMLGLPRAGYHFEFTRKRAHPVAPSPTVEDLVVFYIPSEAEWRATCGSLLVAGFKPVPSANPYWEARGRSFADVDGYRIVLQRAAWTNAAVRASLRS